ncbi:hypothetical protein GLUCOINTEAF2_0201901 [Komagataeibacter intermedius AF2]|uniref:Lipase n=3 Tax=Komagataeibacter intermedius TaxID=66229 RepID=A0A0N1FAD1_9PROT|nr:hypothetical protein GLUCOINTEAF2_0201901 [Komagataeibacter intermedius AF2]GBQ68366.1 hypothetical protein AA0521_1226 [Komagataeibacter intermedius NRIC 0521]
MIPKSCLLLSVAAGLTLGSAHAEGVLAPLPPFYEWSEPVSAAPGTMLRTEKLTESWLPPATGKALRMLYSSTNGLNNTEKTAVSGYILFPKSAPPKGGWPLVSWEHGTVGFADQCAPSRRGPSPRDQAYLDAWLKKGFAVVATDYQGLGTEGLHPYLLYRPEAYSALDAARAVIGDRSLNIQNRIVLIGQSQGAGAALAAAWEYPHYAPQLHIVGGVLTGLVTAIGDKERKGQTSVDRHYTTIMKMDPAFAMLRLAGSDQAIAPRTDLPAYLSEKGKALYKTANEGCLHDLFNQAKALDIHEGGELVKSDLPPSDAKFNTYFDLPDGHVTIPLFVGTGLSDNMAGTNGQYEAVKTLCQAGTSVAWYKYPGLTHSGTVNYALQDSWPFVQDVMDGRTVPSSCHDLAEPGPIQPPRTDVKFNN